MKDLKSSSKLFFSVAIILAFAGWLISIEMRLSKTSISPDIAAANKIKVRSLLIVDEDAQPRIAISANHKTGPSIIFLDQSGKYDQIAIGSDPETSAAYFNLRAAGSNSAIGEDGIFLSAKPNAIFISLDDKKSSLRLKSFGKGPFITIDDFVEGRDDHYWLDARSGDFSNFPREK